MREVNNNYTVARTQDGVEYKLERRETLPSAANLAREYAVNGFPDKYVVFCERQRKVLSDKEKPPRDPWEYGVFISCILRPALFPSQVAMLSPLSAVALINALDNHTSKKLGICWVSDIYCDGVKIGGVNVEGKLNGYGSYDYILVNFSVALNEQIFPSRLTDLVKKVFVKENISVPTIIAKNVLNEFFSAYSQLKTPQKLMNIYNNRFALRKNKVKLIKDGKKRKCKVLGVKQDNLALILDFKGNAIEITSPNSVVLPKKIKMAQTVQN